MKYVAELAHVREVSLPGSADLGFWAERLRGEGLTPVEHAGRARVLVVACDSKFFGVRVRGRCDRRDSWTGKSGRPTNRDSCRSLDGKTTRRMRIAWG